MMNILVPTDFSIFAQHGFELGLQLAKRYNATLHLFHCAELPDGWADLDAESRARDNINKYIAIEARNKLNELKKYASTQDVSCHFHYSGGKFLKSLKDYLNENSIDLIIMGSHGASGKEEWFIGSNSQKVIRKIPLNTLIVKDSIQNFQPSKVVFVTGLDETDKDAFRQFLEFVRPFKVDEVHVLAIDTASWFSQPSIVMLEGLKDFKEIAKDYNCSAHFYKDYSIQAGIRHFVEERSIDFIGVSYLHKNPIKRLFLGSNVEMLVNHTDLPVLCINK